MTEHESDRSGVSRRNVLLVGAAAVGALSARDAAAPPGASNQNIANGVITAVDSSGQIRIRGGANPTRVIIDRIGYMI